MATAWNCGLVITLVYAAQGMGVVSHYFNRWNTPRALRVVFAATLVAALATPVLGLVVAAVLPLLGVTEVWIPYRKAKGVGA